MKRHGTYNAEGAEQTRLEITFGCPAFLCLMGCVWTWRGMLLFLCALLLHEAGHAIVLRLVHVRVKAVRLGMSPAQLISGPGAAEAVSPAANAASSLAQHSLVRALAEEIVEAALRRSGEWAGLDAAETGNAPDGAYRYALYEAHGAARVPYAYGILGQQRLDGEWKTVAMIAPFSNDSAATAQLARLCTGQQLEPIHILDVIHDFMNIEARTL